MRIFDINKLADNLGLDTNLIYEWENKYNINVPCNEMGEKYYTEKEESLYRKIKIIKNNISDEKYSKKLIDKLTQDTDYTITISDIAKVAKVSLGTASRVLNDRGGNIKISDSTRDRVLNVIKELGYKRNPFAAALRGQRCNIIGAVIRDIEDPFLRIIIRAIQKEIHSMGFELFIGHAEYELQTAERQLNLMLNRWVDGLIVLGNFSGGANMVKSLQSPNTPIVSIASGTNTNLPFVDFDQTQGAILALNYLFKLNHRKIAFIGNDQISGVNERLNTYREFMKSNLLDIPVEYINDNVLTSSQAQIYTRKLLSLPLPPTALFCASDVIALGAMSGAWQMGWQIPKDLSIIGYDDITEAKDAYIPLTTIKQPASLAAKKAVEMLLNLINSPSDSSGCKSKILQPQLVIRESCFGPKDHTID